MFYIPAIRIWRESRSLPASFYQHLVGFLEKRWYHTSALESLSHQSDWRLHRLPCTLQAVCGYNQLKAPGYETQSHITNTHHQINKEMEEIQVFYTCNIKISINRQASIELMTTCKILYKCLIISFKRPEVAIQEAHKVLVDSFTVQGSCTKAFRCFHSFSKCN